MTCFDDDLLTIIIVALAAVSHRSVRSEFLLFSINGLLSYCCRERLNTHTKLLINIIIIIITIISCDSAHSLENIYCH